MTIMLTAKNRLQVLAYSIVCYWNGISGSIFCGHWYN